MKFGSVCSGIEAASCAWHPLGWQSVFFSEIENFPSAVLKARWPETPNLGDMTKYKEWPDANLDVLVGGTPCQSFSVAGLRAGLDDARGNLMLTFAAIARKYRPRWVVWENVPGVFSSGEGRDFGSLLAILSGRAVECPESGWQNCGIVPGIESAYGLAWRVLDAQYFGVAQRRRRVFVVGYLGDWRRAAAVFLEREGMRGDSPPRRRARKNVADDVRGGVAGSLGAHKTGGWGVTELDGHGAYIPEGQVAPEPGDPLVIRTHNLHDEKKGDVWFSDKPGALQAVGSTPNQFDAIAIQAGATRENPDSGPNGSGINTDGAAFTVEARAEVQAVAFKPSHFTRGKDGAPDDLAPPLSADADKGDQDALVFETRFARNGRGAPDSLVPPLKAQSGATGRGDAAPVVCVDMGGGKGGANVSEETAPVLNTSAAGHAIGVPQPFFEVSAACHTMMENYGEFTGDGNETRIVKQAMQVRRLTPRECERLQGFADDYTDIIYKGEPASDGPRYKALGNSMAVPCMRWIGERIAFVDAIPAADPALDTGEWRGARPTTDDAAAEVRVLTPDQQITLPEIPASMGFEAEPIAAPQDAPNGNAGGRAEDSGSRALAAVEADSSPVATSAGAASEGPARGPCAKRRVVCTIQTTDGDVFEGENDCANPQPTCPREPGENYEKCRSICLQTGHAETEALVAAKLAGANTEGAVATVTGHYWICEPCAAALRNAGVKLVRILND